VKAPWVCAVNWQSSMFKEDLKSHTD